MEPNDVTTRREAEGGEWLRTKDAALLEQREEASRKIARELHDDVTQRLAVLAMEVATALQQASPEVALLLRSIQNRVAGAAEAIGRISHRIYPSILDDLGLARAIQAICVAGEQGCAVSFEAGPLPPVIPRPAAACLYFVAREALDNAARHARADSVWVQLSSAPGSVTLQVIDSGVGFDAEETERTTVGLGIYAMRERVRLVRGKLAITSEPAAGTRLEVTVPVEDAA